MRAFFAAFLLSWVAGLTLGVFGWPIVTAGGAVAVAAVLGWWQRTYWPVTIAAGGLLLLGWVYGMAAMVEVWPCAASNNVHAQISAVQKITEQTVRYVAVTPEGCRILLTAPRWPRYAEGDMLKLIGAPEPVDKLAKVNSNYAAYLKDQGIQLTIRFPAIQLVRSQPTYLARARQVVRQRVELVFAEPEASLVLAVLMGERGTLPEELEEDFRLTGVTHLLSISGWHMSLMVSLLFLLLLLLPLSPWWRTGLVLLLMWLYLAFLNWPPAATRAVIFWSVLLWGRRLGLLLSLPTVVLLALVSMATYDPHLLRDVGFQLSVLAVIGIGLVMFLSHGYLSRRAWLHWLVLSTLVTLGATLATWPIILYRFGNMALVSPVANLLVQPVFPVLMAVSLATLLLSLVLPAPALLGSWLVGWLYDGMALVTHGLAALPGAALTDLTISLPIIYVYYLALLAISALLLKLQRRRWREMWIG